MSASEHPLKLKFYPLAKLFPNVITIAAICVGLTSIRYSLDGKWEIAVALVIISGLLDILDGRVARFLKVTSDFGAHLDSLADFVNFGVTPAIVLYLWNLKNIEIKGLGWGIVLFFTVCCVVRLARFNTEIEDEDRPAWKNKFFTGVPSTAGGYLVLIPLMLDFEFEQISAFVSAEAIGAYVIIIGLLMVSRLPTFSTKKLIIRREHASLVLLAFGICVTLLVNIPWIFLSLAGITYLSLIPFSIRSYNRAKVVE